MKTPGHRHKRNSQKHLHYGSNRTTDLHHEESGPKKTTRRGEAVVGPSNHTLAITVPKQDPKCLFCHFIHAEILLTMT